MGEKQPAANQLFRFCYPEERLRRDSIDSLDEAGRTCCNQFV